MLRHPIRRANHFISRLNDMVAAQQFVDIPEFRQSENSGGILTRKILERLQPFAEEMNEQANQIDKWREKIIQMLRLPVLDQTVDPNGEYLFIKSLLTMKQRISTQPGCPRTSFIVSRGAASGCSREDPSD